MAQNATPNDEEQTTNDLSEVRPGDLLRMVPEGRGTTVEGTVVAVYKNSGGTPFAVVQKSDRRTHTTTLKTVTSRTWDDEAEEWVETDTTVQEHGPNTVRLRSADEVQVVPGGGNDDYNDRTREYLTEANRQRFPLDEDEDEHGDIIRRRSQQAAYGAVARMDEEDVLDEDDLDDEGDDDEDDEDDSELVTDGGVQVEDARDDEVRLPSDSAADVLQRADENGVSLDEFAPEDASDLLEGMVVSTSRDASHARLVVISEVFTGDDGRDRVRYHIDGYEATEDTRTVLVESFVSRVAFEEWVVVPYSARTDEADPYRCPECGRFAFVHAGISDAFASGGCDSCGAIFTHDNLVSEGAIVELLI